MRSVGSVDTSAGLAGQAPRAIVAAAVVAALAMLTASAGAEPRHGLSTFGDLKYGPDFQNFEYVDVGAPKGGVVRLRDLGSFDSVNPFITKGIRLRGMGGVALTLPFESLMTGAGDEPDSLYGLIAESVDVAPDKSWVSFKLRPQARWHDGTPITVDDVIFSFVTLKELGRPSMRLQLANIDTVEQTGPGQVTFTFAADVERRDLPALAATMPILSKRYYEGVEFDKTTLEPPMGSGPYRIAVVSRAAPSSMSASRTIGPPTCRSIGGGGTSIKYVSISTATAPSRWKPSRRANMTSARSSPQRTGPPGMTFRRAPTAA